MALSRAIIHPRSGDGNPETHRIQGRPSQRSSCLYDLIGKPAAADAAERAGNRPAPPE